VTPVASSKTASRTNAAGAGKASKAGSHVAASARPLARAARDGGGLTQAAADDAAAAALTNALLAVAPAGGSTNKPRHQQGRFDGAGDGFAAARAGTGAAASMLTVGDALATQGIVGGADDLSQQDGSSQLRVGTRRRAQAEALAALHGAAAAAGSRTQSQAW
jgi:hypothetical protein